MSEHIYLQIFYRLSKNEGVTKRMSENKVSCVYPRLQLAYLLQFAIWGSWSVALGGYLNGKMPGADIGYLFMAIPIGAIIAPMIIGPIADKYFAAQKVLGVLHLISGAALAACGYISMHAEQVATQAGSVVSVPFVPLMVLMLISGLCYMPSIPLINTVVFRHIPDSASAPKVFIFGTVGWILVNLVVEIFGGGAGAPYFFFIGGGCGIFLGLYSFTLPSTPPKPATDAAGKSGSIFGALGMFAKPSFTLFVLCAFMVSIFGSNYFFPSVVAYLTEYGYPAAVALTTLNQFSELFFMAALTVCVAKFGLKWVLVLGMSAWGLRYLIFTQAGFSFALAGLLLHGLAYAFLYTAAYMFGDKVAPENLKASVQSLLAFLLLGIGQVLSGFFFGYQIDKYAPEMATIPGTTKAIPAWTDPDSQDSGLRYLDLAKSVGILFAKAEQKADWWKPSENIGTYEEKDQKLSNDVAIPIDKVPDKFKSNGTEYTKEELKKVVDEVKAKTGAKTVTRNEWLKVQRHDWKGFFLWPATFIGFWVLLFMLFGREPVPADEVEKKEEETTSGPADGMASA